jgi:hypothetical protein
MNTKDRAVTLAASGAGNGHPVVDDLPMITAIE